MSTATASKSTLYCSFCGKSQHEVFKLIAGPTVFICDECVMLCLDVVMNAHANPLQGRFLQSDWEILSGTDPSVLREHLATKGITIAETEKGLNGAELLRPLLEILEEFWRKSVVAQEGARRDAAIERLRAEIAETELRARMALEVELKPLRETLRELTDPT